jgi:outer membrane protein TolC
LFQGTIHNRVAQGDYGVEQLQLRQGDLVERRNQNQLVVDISNYMVALRQARSRYSQAVDSRKLLEELLEKSQQSFSFGAATISDVEAAQTALSGRAGNRSRHASGL